MSRLRLALLAVALCAAVAVAQKAGGQKAAAADGTHCQAGMFACRGESTCIPADWVGDGEADCADGSDEDEPPAAAGAPNSSDQRTPPRPSPSQRPAATTTPKAQTLPAAVEGEAECDEQSARRIIECAADFDLWIQDLATTNFSATSLFLDELTRAKLEQGCQLLNDYSGCIDGTPASCPIPSTELADFQAIETYACQLLTPTAKEHSACFASARHSSCSNVRVPAQQSTLCKLVASVAADIDCVAKIRPADCSDGALEMFEPMRTETEHVHRDLECRAAKPAVEANIDSATTQEAKPEEFEQEIPTAAQKVEPVRPTQPATTTTSTQRPATTTTAATATTQRSGVVDLSNSLFAFGNVATICVGEEDKATDIWASVRRRVCSRKEDLQPHAACFLESALREKRCVKRLPKATNCAAIDTFNTNIDCVINVLNDVCPVDAQDVVIAIQEGLNDEAIAQKCYEEKDAAQRIATDAPLNDDGFQLRPRQPRCSAEQENQALVCLVELIEINKKLAWLQTSNFLLEVSTRNSTLINPICELYDKYEKCLNTSVFAKNGGHRCAFNSPLNTLARIGLSPICAPISRQLLVESRPCFQKVAQLPTSQQCQSGLQHLGRTVELMIQGIHGEALLCQSFYILRDTFDCGERIIKEHCEPTVLKDLQSLKEKMTDLGLEEGCPAVKPADLDAIIARPVTRPVIPAPPSITAPVARPMQPPAAPAAASSGGACEPEEQKRFTECVQPLTAFQPHPLAVIKQPKDIELACKAYATFNDCRAKVRCNPLWARGMSSMFDYACGPGHERFLDVRQCVRKVTTREDIRECVTTFSKGAPQQACDSSNKLLHCSLPAINEKCGVNASDFVREYVRRFATTIDANCRVGETLVDEARAIHTFNCTASEIQLVEHCSAPLNDISARLDELFQGGLQSFLKNLNALAPVFAQGCNLTAEFRECARPVLEAGGPCVVSSCLIKSGAGICNQPDVTAAIDNNLGCVFKQVSDPEFGKCLRTTIATLKNFNLAALRTVLPQFVSCVEPIVLGKCGAVPLNVLRAFGAQGTCPVAYKPEPVPDTPPVMIEPPTCTEERKKEFDECSANFFQKYAFEAVTLIGEKVAVDELCADLEAYQQCYAKAGVCEQRGSQSATRQFVQHLCATKEILRQHRDCLRKTAQSAQGRDCLQNADSDFCAAITHSTDCVAARLDSDCGTEAMQYAFAATNEYLRDVTNGQCVVTAPNVAIQTGCTEADLIHYLECETLVDRFRFRPITFINNASKWDEFCSVVATAYRPCIDKLPCRFEPVSTASLTLFENLCERDITRRDQRRFADCYAEVADSAEGKKCLDAYTGVDLLAKEAPRRLCAAMNSVLGCAAAPINARCGYDALLHSYDIHGTWVRAFNATCTLEPSTDVQKALTTAAAPKTETTRPSTDGTTKPAENQTKDRTEAAEKPTESTAAPATTAKPENGALRVAGLWAVVALLAAVWVL